MYLSQGVGGSNRYRAHRNVQGSLIESGNQPGLASEHGIQRRIVGEHGDHGRLSRCCLLGGGSEYRASIDQ
jgi:hypothetical protein